MSLGERNAKQFHSFFSLCIFCLSICMRIHIHSLFSIKQISQNLSICMRFDIHCSLQSDRTSKSVNHSFFLFFFISIPQMQKVLHRACAPHHSIHHRATGIRGASFCFFNAISYKGITESLPNHLALILPDWQFHGFSIVFIKMLKAFLVSCIFYKRAITSWKKKLALVKNIFIKKA